MNDLKTTHRGVEITYSEATNEWTCEHFKRGSSALTAAKERIDKFLDAEKKEPFERFKAFYKSFGYNDGWQEGEVTGITEDKKEVWMKIGGNRKKVGTNYSGDTLHVYPSTEENTALIAEITELETQISKLKQTIIDKERKLTPYTPKK